MARTMRKDVRALRSIQNIYELSDKQVFCETKKAWEIWFYDFALEVKYRVIRIPKNRIIFVWTKEVTQDGTL
jgi:hypothetical protein